MQKNAAVAQLVEHQLPKLRVASSSLVCRSFGHPSANALGCFVRPGFPIFVNTEAVKRYADVFAQ